MARRTSIKNMCFKNEIAAEVIESLMQQTSSDLPSSEDNDGPKSPAGRMAGLSLEPSPVALSEDAAMTACSTSSDKSVHSTSSTGDIDIHVKKTDGRHFLGFRQSEREQLMDFVTDIKFKAVSSGVFLKDGPVQPSSGMYREKREFVVIKNLHPTHDVLLCQDKSKGQQFVLKTILRAKLPPSERLLGIEYLVKHYQSKFFPDVYAVYKDKEHFYVFEQYLGEYTVHHCDWNIGKVCAFSKALLEAVKHLHDNNFVHFDIKPMNIMVLDRENPESLKLIDLESGKSDNAKLHMGGYTLVYLPQWHEALLSLESFDTILMSCDLWAVACVVMMFLNYTSEKRDLQTWFVWKQELEGIKKSCTTCKICERPDTSEWHCKCNKCFDCRDKFLEYLTMEGHRILHIHLGRLMETEIQDATLKRVIDLLKYLTDKTNFEDKSAARALHILRGE